MSFDRFVERILRHEGGYVDHPRDPGGATNYGITEYTLERARKVMSDLPMRVRDLTRDQAKRIYEELYWKNSGADKLPLAIGFQLFDAVVNHDMATAVKWLQRAAGAAADGIVGPATVRVVEAHDPASLATAFLSVRLEYYTNLSTFRTFGKGWMRRMAENLDYLATDL